MFDTSDTLSRVETELRAIGYFDAPPPDPVTPAPLAIAATVMAMAEHGDQVTLARRWLALLIECLDDGEIEDLLPKTWPELLNESHATVIRDIAIRRELATKRPENRHVPLPPWSSVKPYQPPSAPAEIERYAILRYFADLKTPVATIEAERDKLLARSAKRSLSPFHLLAELAVLPEALSLLRKIDDDDTTTFLFGVDGTDQDESRIVFKLEQNSEHSIIVGEFWIVSKTLLRWQGRSDNPECNPVHFTSNYLSTIAEDQLASRSLHPMGGWTYRLDQSRKVLLERVSDMVSFWPQTSPLLEFHRQPLTTRLLEMGLEETLAKRVEIADRNGFFRAEVEIFFAFGCLGLESGKEIGSIVARLEEALGAVNPRNSKLATWREGVERLRRGEVWFPPELAGILPSRRL